MSKRTTYTDELTGRTLVSWSRPAHISWKIAANEAIKAGAAIFVIKTKTLYVPWDGCHTLARA